MILQRFHRLVLFNAVRNLLAYSFSLILSRVLSVFQFGCQRLLERLMEGRTEIGRGSTFCWKETTMRKKLSATRKRTIDDDDAEKRYGRRTIDLHVALSVCHQQPSGHLPCWTLFTVTNRSSLRYVIISIFTHPTHIIL
jgi:hypothetical protein